MADTSQKRILLVDTSSYFYRAFHAIQSDMRSPGGEPTKAIYGVVNMLRKLKQDFPSDYIACVFDPPGKTFRDAIYPEYKATRSAMPEDLAVQLGPLRETIDALGWPMVEVPGFEADDVIGTLACNATRAFCKTVISTGDKDLTQLVNDKVLWVNTMSNERLGPEGVKDKFGVPPHCIVDYLTLVGDAVDNVPGVDKIGPKTAAKLLQEYGSLDAIVANVDKIKGVVGENIRKAADWLPTARTLVTVKTDVPLPFEVEALLDRGPDVQRLLQLYERFGFRSMREALTKGEGADLGPKGADEGRARSEPPDADTTDNVVGPAVASSGEPGAAPPANAGASAFVPTRAYECVLDEAALDKWLARIDAAPLTCFDTETTSLDPMLAQLVGISLSVEAGAAAYIPLKHDYPGAPEQLDFDRTLAKLKPWFESERHAKLAQHAKYDCHVLANHGVAVRGIAHDTLLESYVFESNQRHDMDSLAMRHLGAKTILYEEVAGKGASQIGFNQVDLQRATEYSAEDADVTFQLQQVLGPRVAGDAKLNRIYADIEIPVSRVLLAVERNGVLIDARLLATQTTELSEKMLELERRAYEEAGQPFNLGSPKQIGEILFNQKKLPVLRKTPSGAPSTDEEVLEKLALDHPLPKLLLEHRGLSKLRSTYTDKLPRMVNGRTGRVHTNYAQAVAVTGRLSSTDPNLQNIPVRTAEGRRIREAFIAPPNAKIVSADYSQIELRIMAHLSGDRSLIDAFARGEDIHRHTAAEVFGVPIGEVSSEHRRYAKVINFGLIYGMSAFGLAGNLGIERSAAASYMDKYFARYPGVAQYMERTRQEAREHGYVETVFGRRLWLPDIGSANQARRQGAERQAINAPMQGTAADLIKLAMVEVQDWLVHEKLKTLLVMQVHDELVLEVPDDELERVKPEVERLMMGVAKLEVPLVVEAGVGENWEKAH